MLVYKIQKKPTKQCTFEDSVNCSTPSHTTYSTPYETKEILSRAQEDNKVSKYGKTDNV